MSSLIEVLSLAYSDPVAIDRIARAVAVRLDDLDADASAKTRWRVLLERAAEGLPALWSLLLSDPLIAEFHDEIRRQISEDEGELQSITNAALGLSVPGETRQVNLDAERRTALVEVDGAPAGTGFLVGPDLLITAHHVIGMDWPPTVHVVAVFDRLAGDASPTETGERVTVVEWIAGSLPTDPERMGRYDAWEDPRTKDRVDYAVGRLEREIGSEAPAADPSRPRGYYPLSDTPYRFDNVQYMTIHQHPLGMHQVMDTIIGPLSVNTHKTRVRYGGNTLKGSSGSACIDPRGRVIALHHFATPRKNQGVPISAIVADLREKKLWDRCAPQRRVTRESRHRVISMIEAEQWGWTVKDVLEKLVALDHEVIGPMLDSAQEGSPDHWVPLFERNRDAWRLLIDRKKQIVGYWEMHPVDVETFEVARTGRLVDGRLDHGSVLSFEFPGYYDVYFSMIAVTRRARDGGTLRLLVDSILASLTDLASRDVLIRRIVAAAWTGEGESLCKQFGLSRSEYDHVVGDSRVPIYVGSMKELVHHPVAEKWRQLRERYAREMIEPPPRRPNRVTTTPPLKSHITRPPRLVAIADGSRRVTPAAFSSAIARWAAHEGTHIEGDIATLMDLKSPFDGTTTQALRITAWLNEAIRKRASVILMDFGSDQPAETWTHVIKGAIANGCLLIAAAGDLKKPFYPAWNSGVLAVAALDRNGQVPSDARPDTRHRKPDLFAGGNLEATPLAALASQQKPSSNAAARAMVSALLVWATDPTLDAQKVRSRLCDTAKPLEPRSNVDAWFALETSMALAKTRSDVLLRGLSERPCRTAELAELIGVTRSALTPILQRMMGQGTIVYTSNSDTYSLA